MSTLDDKAKPMIVNNHSNKKTPELILAIESGDLEVIHYLLERKIPGKWFGYYTVDLNATDANKKTALMHAIEKGNPEIVQKIAFGQTRGFFRTYSTNLTLFDENGKTALTYAMEKGDLEIIRIMLRAHMPTRSGCF